MIKALIYRIDLQGASEEADIKYIRDLEKEITGSNQPIRVTTDALVDALKAYGRRVELIVLNSCKSEEIAQRLVDVCACAIGIGKTIRDHAAMIFASVALALAAAGSAHARQDDIDLGRLSTAAESSGVDLDLDSLGNTAIPGTSTDIDLSTIGSAETSAPIPAMDFSLDLPGDEKTQSQMAQVDSSNFDLKLDDLGSASAGQDGGLDFDINQISLESEGATKAEPVFDLTSSAPAMPELDLSSISLDLGSPTATEEAGAAKDDKWYDVQTKFDLAKAYQEMGDKEGAREILREVIAEGDNDQKAAAEKVLSTLS